MDRRDSVIQATLALLVERGWRGVTTDEVAKRAHISKKTLYRLFPSKHELLQATLHEFLRVSLARLDEILGADAHPIVAVDRLLQEISGLVSQIQSQILSQAREMNPELWKQVEEERGKRLKAVGQLIERAQAEGLVRPDLQVHLWLLLLRTVVEALVNPQRVLREGLSAQEIVDTLRKVLFEGILTEEGRRVLIEARERGEQ